MILLALDQSSRTTGYSVFNDKNLIDSGTFTCINDNIGKRLVKYESKILELIDKYKVDKIAFEDIQMQGGNVVTYKALAEIFGITHYIVTKLDIPYEVISSNTWKSQLGIKGKQRAEQKKNAQKYVAEHYNKKVSEDESDAICIGTCAVGAAGHSWE